MNPGLDPQATGSTRRMRLRDAIRFLRVSFAGFHKGPVGRDAIKSMAVRAGALGAAFVQAVVTARLLGPEGYGTFAFAMSVASIAATCALFGYDKLAMREAAYHSARLDTDCLRGFLRFALTVVVGGSLVVAAGVAIVALATNLLDPPFRKAVALAALLVPPIALLTFFRGVAQGVSRVLLAQLPGDLFRPLAIALLFGALLLAGQSRDVGTVIGLAFAVILVAAVAGGFPLWRQFHGTPNGDPPAGRVRAALPFAGLSVVGILQGEINVLMLGALAGPTEAGLFQPIARITPVVLIGVQAAGMRYAPRVSELWARGNTQMLQRITRLFTLTTSVITVLIAGFVLLAGPYLMAAFGPEFVASASLLWWVVMAQVFNAACGPAGRLLTMTGRSESALFGQLAGLFVNIILGAWLIPDFGAEGAAMAMAAGIAVWNLMILLLVRRVIGFDPSFLKALHGYLRPEG